MNEVSAGVDPVRVDILGLGRSGYGIHLKALLRLPEYYKIVAVSDTWPERLESVSHELGVVGHDSIEKLVAQSNVEIISIASPSHLHCEHTVAALEAGKHVVCEKPFGLTLDDVVRMETAAHATGLTLTAFYNRRYEETFQKVLSVVSSGILGKVTHMRMNWGTFSRRWDWQVLADMGGGQLNNNGPHALDQALLLLRASGVDDHECATIFADVKMTGNFGDADDHVRVTFLDEASGVTLDLELFSSQVFEADRWLICGSAGGLRGDATSLEWKWVDTSVLPRHSVDRTPSQDRSYCKEELKWMHERFVATDKFSDWALKFYRDHYSFIRHGTEPFVSLESARNVTKMLERIRKSIRL